MQFDGNIHSENFQPINKMNSILKLRINKINEKKLIALQNLLKGKAFKIKINKKMNKNIKK